VDGSSTGTSVPWMWALLKLPRFGGASHADDNDNRFSWTLELLADAMVRLTGHDSLSGETVRRRLAENDLKPWRKDMWCIPKVDGEYVARMEAAEAAA
jgi:hypothetical protein